MDQKEAVCEEVAQLDRFVEQEVEKLRKPAYRIDQTRTSVRVAAVVAWQPSMDDDVQYQKGIFWTFGELYKYFSQNYRDTAYGAKLELIGLEQRQEALLRVQWYGGDPRTTNTAL